MLPGEALFLFVIFVVFLELGFLFEKQFLDLPTLFGIRGDLEHFAIVLNVLPYDKTFHEPPPKGRTTYIGLELDQCGLV